VDRSEIQQSSDIRQLVVGTIDLKSISESVPACSASQAQMCVGIPVSLSAQCQEVRDAREGRTPGRVGTETVLY
jgi:hypothetical protein